MSAADNRGYDFRGDFCSETPLKRRRISTPKADHPPSYRSLFTGTDRDSGTPSDELADEKDNCQDEEGDISISVVSRQAGQTVAPFLAKHIPDQYAPGGGQDRFAQGKRKDPNTKYCYRHRPDLKCRRQANEPSMDQLQHVRSIAYVG